MTTLADKIERVGVLVNTQKVSCADVVRRARRLLSAAGRKVHTDAATAVLTGIKDGVYPDAATLAREVDLLVVFGGDGTMLRVAREIAGSRTPILGINIGGLGFLTAVPSVAMAGAFQRVWKGEFTFESRVLLRATGSGNSRTLDQSALNDIVISRGVTSRLIELDVRICGDASMRYRCDGLIVSSPTGSTAYSLAAGGAVVFPTANVIELTPICPHTLANRSLILPASASVEITVLKPATILSADGQATSELGPDDVITIGRSRRTVRLMNLAGSSFCETLRRKLHWRGAPFDSGV